jgi:hypothetical protein
MTMNISIGGWNWWRSPDNGEPYWSQVDQIMGDDLRVRYTADGEEWLEWGTEQNIIKEDYRWLLAQEGLFKAEPRTEVPENRESNMVKFTPVKFAKYLKANYGFPYKVLMREHASRKDGHRDGRKPFLFDMAAHHREWSAHQPRTVKGFLVILGHHAQHPAGREAVFDAFSGQRRVNGKTGI